MKWTKQIKLFLAFWVISYTVYSQNFYNLDLDGDIIGPSSLPAGWQNVPFEDVNCYATSSVQATSDLTDANGSGGGVIGNPYSGTTFVSGLYAGTAIMFHEGIQQSVTGFSVGEVYVISFYQTVIKQNNALDRCGSWAVYANGTLVAVAPLSRSAAPHSSTSHIWNLVTITFTATADTNLIQFLPFDDDTNRVFSASDTSGALRMGIDYIQILNTTVGVEERSHTSVIANVYPNPFNQSTTIQFNNQGKESYTFQLYNSNGQLVSTINDITDNTVIIEKNDLTPGFYFFVLGTNGGLAATGRLMVE